MLLALDCALNQHFSTAEALQTANKTHGLAFHSFTSTLNFLLKFCISHSIIFAQDQYYAERRLKQSSTFYYSL